MSYKKFNQNLLRLYNVRLELSSLAYLLERRADDYPDVKEMEDMNHGLGQIIRRLCTRLQRIEERLRPTTDVCRKLT